MFIYDLIIENWERIALIGTLILILFLSGNITKTIRGAREGLKESVTPLGFFIFLVIAYIAYQIYLEIMVSI